MASRGARACRAFAPRDFLKFGPTCNDISPPPLANVFGRRPTQFDGAFRACPLAFSHQVWTSAARNTRAKTHSRLLGCRPRRTRRRLARRWPHASDASSPTSRWASSVCRTSARAASSTCSRSRRSLRRTTRSARSSRPTRAAPCPMRGTTTSSACGSPRASTRRTSGARTSPGSCGARARAPGSATLSCRTSRQQQQQQQQ